MGKTPVIVGHDPATCSLYSGVGPSPGDPLDRAAVLRQPTGLSHGTGFDNLVTGAHVEGQSNDSFRGNRREIFGRRLWVDSVEKLERLAARPVFRGHSTLGEVAIVDPASI